MESSQKTPQETTAPVFHIAHHAKLGPILAMLVLVLALILGGLFLWGKMLADKAHMSPPPPIVNNEPETPRAEADTQILGTVSTSDEIGAIEADLESTRLDLIDQDLQSVDNEFDAATSDDYEVQ